MKNCLSSTHPSRANAKEIIDDEGDFINNVAGEWTIVADSLAGLIVKCQAIVANSQPYAKAINATDSYMANTKDTTNEKPEDTFMDS